MQICRDTESMIALSTDWRAAGTPSVLVATMGALHDGHRALVARARDWADSRGGRVVASVFVNPTQFGDAKDHDKYPRTEEADLALLRAAGADAVFLPQASDIYLPDAQTVVDVTGLSRVLMGKLRPGHFRGVATVVTKLFNITGCDAATFGEKDYQQLTLVRQMVRDLNMRVQILPVPTVREADGLAMSSRNQRLTPADRAAAPVLARALDRAEAMVTEGRTVEAVRHEIKQVLASEPRADVQSIDIRDASQLSALRGRPTQSVVILLAARFGDVLLIDQRVALPSAD
ncbi:pantoate--beta-alanine ligase [Paracoccus tegillarcae]|uniref:Pantothenate synthetase n=1 Tax=Paracoccus tegillarcae TaxID=1529068 RepID=A0A2K9EVV7_9RHOB|nr:pantoate--beta-alanine ligase [Paracoccus tegillarcae]AUH35046.1 pantoate--beta-alanine ligase [Paracoccus tegillarcae]